MSDHLIFSTAKMAPPQLKLAGTQAKCTKGPFWTQLEYTKGPFWTKLDALRGHFGCQRQLERRGHFYSGQYRMVRRYLVGFIIAASFLAITYTRIKVLQEIVENSGYSLFRVGAMSLNLQLPVNPGMNEMHSNPNFCCTHPNCSWSCG